MTIDEQYAVVKHDEHCSVCAGIGDSHAKEKT